MGHRLPRIAKRIGTEHGSIFDRMNRLAEAHQAVNLGQGFPDFSAPAFARNAALSAVAAENDQYARIPGELVLRSAVASFLQTRGFVDVDAEGEVTITCGCQEALAAALLALVDPGDEVIIIEPFFETYKLCVCVAGGIPKFVTLRPPDFGIVEADVRTAVTERTRVIIVNSPHNPTGRVFSRAELATIASICLEFDLIAVSDEVYEELVFEGEHVRLASMEGMRDRTVTLSSLGKTFSVTGWKIGWAVAPPMLTDAIRRAHQALAFSIAKPLQIAAVGALSAPPEYFTELRARYRTLREILVDGLQLSGFRIYRPAGTYFVMADISSFGLGDDDAFCALLVKRLGVAAIPASYLYEHREEGRTLVRFAFCKSEATLVEAVRRLRNLTKIA